MVDYREIPRLASKLRNSQRQITASVGSSYHTIKEVVETARFKGSEWPLEEVVSNDMLMSILFTDKYESSSCFLEPDYEFIHIELAKPDVTMTLIWNEYRIKCGECGKRLYMVTQFGDRYRRWARITKVTMHMHTTILAVLHNCWFRTI